MGRVHILILTASIGAGHTRAAEAIHAAIAARAGENVRISVVDFMARDVSVIHYLMQRVYLIMLRFVPNLYDVFFRFAGSAAGGGVVRSAFAWVMVWTMGRLIRSYRPDLVVATHPFPEGAAALWRARYGGGFLLAGLLTGYALHRIWLSRGVDTYFVATEAMAAQMAELGIDRSLVHVTGIPIARAERHVNRAAAKERAGVPFELPALLLMGGGLGLGDIERTLCALETSQERLAVLVVAGHNAALAADARRAARTSRHLIRVWDYTDEVPLLMRAADLLITKPGALTISEAFAAGLPLLLHDPIPGPETENAVYATRRGSAVWLHPGEQIVPAVAEILANRLPAIRKAAHASAREEAADCAAQILMEMCRSKRGDRDGAKETV